MSRGGQGAEVFAVFQISVENEDEQYTLLLASSEVQAFANSFVMIIYCQSSVALQQGIHGTNENKK